MDTAEGRVQRIELAKLCAAKGERGRGRSAWPGVDSVLSRGKDKYDRRGEEDARQRCETRRLVETGGKRGMMGAREGRERKEVVLEAGRVVAA